MLTREEPFILEGPAEVKHLVTLLDLLVVGEEQEKDNERRQIFPEKLCFGMYSNFSVSYVDTLLQEKGYKTINTYRHDHLPKGCRRFFRHIKAVGVNIQSNMARFEQPIVAVKE